MGVFDFLKSAAVKVKCSAGFHSGEFHPITGKPKCHVEKVCPDCGKYVTDFEHTWGDWKYERDGDCTVSNTCSDCGKIITRIEHEGYYEKPREHGDCHIEEVCRRCNDTKSLGVRHLWRKGCEYEHETYYFCENCDETKHVKKEE